MKKKIAALALLLTMLAGFVPWQRVEFPTVWAADSDFTIEDGVLKKYTGNGGDVVIPDGVTKIGDYCFSWCKSLTSVTIPSSINSLSKDGIFLGCANLKAINVSQGNKFFASVDGVLYNADKTELILCPEGKKGLLTIPDGVTIIGEDAFEHCTSLTNVIIPDSVTIIQRHAFWNCTGLTSVTIPNGVNEIGELAFGGCSNLRKFQVKSGNNSYSSMEGVLYNADKTTLILCPEGKQGEMIVPDTVTKIGYFAFEYCTGLTSITIPDTVSYIAGYAFEDCKGLTSATIPASVTSIGECAFHGCESLTRITLPASVTSIGESAFYGCKSLTDVYYAGAEEQWHNIPYIDYISPNENVTIHYNYAPISVTTQPKDATGAVGDKVTFSVEATGDGLKYQWYYKKADASSWTAWKNGTSASLTAPVYASWNGTQFYCKLTDANGSTLNSDSAKMLVATQITAQPKDATGAVNDKVTFSVSATGSGLTYQWYYKKPTDSSWTLWSGRTSASATATVYASWNGTKYFCKITDANGKTINSGSAKLTVATPLAVTTQPKDATGAVNEKVTFTVKATGSGVKYQWYYKKADASSWTAWKNGTSASLTAPVYASWNGTKFYCKLTDANGNTLNSGSAKMFVATKITQQPVNATGAVNEKVTFTVKATGSGLTYQWYYKKPSDSSWTKWNGRTSASATATVYNSWNGTKYYCKITDANGKTVNSGSAKMIVK